MKTILSLWSCILFVGVAGCGPRNVFEPPPPPEVEVGQPVLQDVTVYRAFPGRLQAVESVAILARVSGTLEDILFRDGDQVEAGQLLFVIEQAPYEADVRRAEAQLAQAHAAHTLAEAAVTRKRNAFAIQAISELDLLSSEADVENASAAIQAAEAGLERARLNLSYTTVTAPISGQVDRHLVSIGNVVGGPQPTLLTTLVSIDPIDCYFSLDERSSILFRRITAEQDQATQDVFTDLVLELADGSVHDATGFIDFTEAQIDPTTGTLLVRARFPNPNGFLVPGMFGRVRIPYQQPGALLVPENAILRDMTGPYVLGVQSDNLVERRSVELGPLVGTQRVIVSGLDQSDRLVTRGIQRARPGLPIRIKPASDTDTGAE